MLTNTNHNRTTVVHFRDSPYDVYIGRPSQFGNPFEIGVHGTRKQVIAKYREWVVKQPDIMAAIADLRGKALGCWCKTKANPTRPCHGDVIAQIADGKLKPPKELGL